MNGSCLLPPQRKAHECPQYGMSRHSCLLAAGLLAPFLFCRTYDGRDHGVEDDQLLLARHFHQRPALMTLDDGG